MFEKYSIKYGDNLNNIANNFGTTTDYIKEINNIYFDDMLRVGMDIIVPKKNNNYYNLYVIEKGDTLYKIGKKYNINPELLASLNGIDSQDYIYPGQEIMIPKSGYSYYITKSGDTIDSVIDTFNIAKDKLLSDNKTIYLMEGQLLINKK